MSSVVTVPVQSTVVITPSPNGASVVTSPASTATIPAAALGVPGNPGPQGAPGVDAVVQTLATSATVAHAAQPSASVPGQVQAASDFTTARFSGVFTASALAGKDQPVQHAGPVSPLTLTLGTGVACAVGCTATGAPCRVTDPACVSGLNFLGWCDDAGTINISPRVADYYDIRDFGAIGDGVNDDAVAVRSAIARMPAVGATLYFPPGQWSFLSGDATWPGVCVIVDKSVALLGASAFSPYDFASRITVPPGHTTFRIAYGVAVSSANLGFTTTGKLVTSSTVAAYTPNTSTITVSNGHDFVKGQVACLPGAGPLIRLTSLTGSVTIGTDTITLTSKLFTLPLLRVGQWIQLGTAYPTPTKIIGRSVSTIQMASNAAASVTDGQMFVAPEMYFRIEDVTGNVLTVDNYNVTGTAISGSALEHADSAIDTRGLCRVTACGAGDYSVATSFAGAGLLLLGDHSFAPPSNCNLSSVSGMFVFGARQAVFAYGVDSQICDLVGVKSIQSTSWAILDMSGYGNTYITPHFDGGLGMLTPDLAHRSVVVGGYSEAGTAYFFGSGTLVLGGLLAGGSGGMFIGADLVSGIQVGTGFDAHRTEMAPATNFEKLSNFASGAPGVNGYGLESRLANGYEGTNDQNLFKWSHTGGTDFNAVPHVTSPTRLAFGVFDVAARWRPGVLWLPRGFVVGTAANHTDNPAVAIVQIVDTAPPTYDSDRLNADGSVDGTWHVGDLVINSAPAPGGVGAWQCTTAGTFGAAVWKAAWTVAP